jgi:hypothetical protein
MRIQANIISLVGSLGCVFWYAVYALVLFFIFVSRILSVIGVQVDSRNKTNQKHSWIQAT